LNPAPVLYKLNAEFIHREKIIEAMKKSGISRRELLTLSCQVSIAGAFLLVGGCGKEREEETVACVNPDALSSGEGSLRASLQYVDTSPDSTKQCSGCAYFVGTGDSVDCGTCGILNGSVRAKGHCTSWAPKA